MHIFKHVTVCGVNITMFIKYEKVYSCYNHRKQGLLCIRAQRHSLLLVPFLFATILSSCTGILANSLRCFLTSSIGHTDSGKFHICKCAMLIESSSSNLRCDDKGQIVSRTGRYRVCFLILTTGFSLLTQIPCLGDH